ncbi:hypothetical protein Rhopal_006356-T1 [Rhodotorula paludigena]|uniref:Uncharacterized protein n=1 Tax=Rhodotorula paludigena TaxID=86838 RepID=A0AAV5GS28_9BASI|nr:hypothetical protein Rhopal_006356-T1 [Rhodotorula paludigena]
MQHFKESIIIAEALGATFLVTRMQSEHGYSTSDFINSPAALEAAVRLSRTITAGQFRGSMRMDNINRILRDLHAEFGTDNLDVTVAMEGHDDVVLAQLDTPQWRVVDTGNVTHDLRALAANNVLLLGGSSYGVLGHLIAPRGLTIVEMGRGHQKYDNTSAFGRLSVKMPEYNPEVLKRLPALVSPV